MRSHTRAVRGRRRRARTPDLNGGTPPASAPGPRGPRGPAGRPDLPVPRPPLRPLATQRVVRWRVDERPSRKKVRLFWRLAQQCTLPEDEESSEMGNAQACPSATGVRIRPASVRFRARTCAYARGVERWRPVLAADGGRQRDPAWHRSCFVARSAALALGHPRARGGDAAAESRHRSNPLARSELEVMR